MYDLSKGSYNPLFGSFELEKPVGKAEVFVIAGGGTGIAAYRALQKKGIPFVTGILHENDVDYQVARDLASEVICERSFVRIGEETYRRAVQRLEACGTVINCLWAYGEMNEKNKALYEQALSIGLKIMRSAEEDG